MRALRLIVPVLVVLVAVPARPVLGQSSGGGGAFGDDQQAGGGLLGDGAAEAFASDGGDLGPADRPRRGGGDVVCRLYNDVTNEPVDLSTLSPELDGKEVQLLRVCEDRATGEYVHVEIITVVPPVNAVVEPRQLAMMARSRLPLPLPAARTNPDGPQTVNIETWLWVDNWQEQSRSAAAGGVVATVTARPVEQRWTFGSPAERVVCPHAGRPYDLSRPAAEQSPTCSYTFRHSSAGQPGAIYQVTATLVWHVTWTSNIGARGDLGHVSRTVTLPTSVAEHQALNDSGRNT